MFLAEFESIQALLCPSELDNSVDGAQKESVFNGIIIYDPVLVP